MTSKLVTLEISLGAPPSIIASCTTPEFSLETFGSRLHIPPPSLTFEFGESKQLYAGIPASVFAIVANRRVLPITDVSVSCSLSNVKKSEPFQSPVQAVLEPSQMLAFSLATLCQENVGAVPVTAVLTYTCDNAKFHVRTKEAFNCEYPLEINLRIRQRTTFLYEVRVENARLGYVIRNVRSEVDGSEVPIAPFLESGESGAGVIVPRSPIQQMKVVWEMPGSRVCSQVVPVPGELGRSTMPLTITVAGLKPVIRALEPFTVTITIESHAKTPLSGELTIRPGAIVLYGLNSLQFTALPPGKSEKLEGLFIAIDEGKFAFPPFHIVTKEGAQFEVDSGNGVFVTGSAV
jgi:hypothetical protein